MAARTMLRRKSVQASSGEIGVPITWGGGGGAGGDGGLKEGGEDDAREKERPGLVGGDLRSHNVGEGRGDARGADAAGGHAGARGGPHPRDGGGHGRAHEDDQ